MAARRRAPWIRYYPEDIIGGCTLLDLVEEGAYRRVLDYIAITKNMLPDDDFKLARISKAGRKWPHIRDLLFQLGKLKSEGGYIRNDRMTEILMEQQIFSERQSARAHSRHSVGQRTEETADEE